MRKLFYSLRSLYLAAVCVAMCGGTAQATVYTAVVSGNFNSAATWGGILPGSVLSSDVVLIPSGINVTLTTVQTISGSTTLTVNGTLSSSTSGTALVMTSGSLAGSGNISVDSMALGLTSGFSFTGAINANKFTSTGATISSAANVTVANTLRLNSGTLNVASGNFTMSTGSDIIRAGGSMTSSGSGSLHLTNPYSVWYTTASATAGAELSGMGLDSLVVNVPGTVTLNSNTAINGTLMLTSGALALNGRTLTMNPTSNFSSSGSGTITGSATSGLIIISTAGLAGDLRFTSGGNTLNAFTVNTGTGNVSLGSDLNVTGVATFSSGTLYLNGHNLTINSAGDLSSGGGFISGSSTSDITINATAGLTNTIPFATGGNMVRNLTINTGAGSNVGLSSDLSVDGTLTLSNGTLMLNDHKLTLNSGSSLASSGTGTIMGSLASDIVINSTTGLAGTLRFAPSGNIVHNLTVNTGSTGNVSLGSDLQIEGMLALSNGTLSLNGHTLTMNPTSDFSASGSGSIMGSATSDIIIISVGGFTGPIRFAPGGNMLDNFTVNVGTSANVSLGSDLTVNGVATLSSGTLSLNGHTLTLNSGSDLSVGMGALVGSSTSSLVVNSTAGLTNSLTFAAGSNVLNNLTVNTGSANNVTLGSNLTVDGMLTLSNGMLMLNGHTLTMNTGSDMAASGTGSIMGSSTSNLVVNSTAGTTGAIRFATGGNTLNNLTINTGSGSNAALGSDLNIDGMLTLNAGSLSLNGHNLTINSGGNLAGTGSGTIMGNAASNITVNNTAGLTGMLNFASGSEMVNNLTLNTGSTGNVSLGSDVTANGTVAVSAGTLNLNGHTLTFGSTGDLSGAGTGTIVGSTSSNIVVNSTSSLSSALHFASGSNMLNNLTVNTGSASNVDLSSDITVNGMLTLSNGTLSLNGHTLTLNTGSDVAGSGTGSIMGSSTSNLVVNSTAGTTGAIRFATAGNMLHDLTVNTGTGSNVMLGSDVTVDGMLMLNSGSLSLNGHHLTINTAGDLSSTGTGNIMGSSTSDITVNNTAGLAGTLRFATGSEMVHNLTLNTGSTGNVSLGSDVTANGMVTIADGMLNLNGHTLTLGTGGDLSSTGTGTMMGGATSNLIVNSTASLSSPLRFATGGNTLNNLTVNTGSGSNVGLSSDLTVNGMLTLSNGSLNLNGHALTLNTGSNIAGTGTGNIMGSSTSDLMINATSGLTGGLRFASGSNMLHNLTVNMGSGTSNVNLGSDLTVGGTLALTAGKIKLGSSNLNVASGATVSGGTANSYVVTDGTGKMTMMGLAAGSTGTFRVGTATNYAPVAITANTGSATGDVSVNVADGVLSAGTTGSSLSATQPVVNATWFVSSSASTGINYNMQTMWSAGMEVNGFNRANAYISHYTGGAWDVQPGMAATTSGSMYAMTRTGITSLSPFMVAQATPVTYVADINANQASISMYPNPALNTVHFTTASNVERVEIFDMSGKNVKSTPVTANAVDVQELAPGVYNMHVMGQNLNTVQQFVKQ